MDARSPNLKWLLPALNLVVFAALLVSKAPEYEQLRKRDEAFWGTGRIELNSADPLHLAARPFDSPAHVPDVPFAENLYFIVNTPPMLMALVIGDSLGDITSGFWTGSHRTSSAWQSWALAGTFALFGAIWSFAIGAAIDSWRTRRHRAVAL